MVCSGSHGGADTQTIAYKHTAAAQRYAYVMTCLYITFDVMIPPPHLVLRLQDDPLRQKWEGLLRSTEVVEEGREANREQVRRRRERGGRYGEVGGGFLAK